MYDLSDFWRIFKTFNKMNLLPSGNSRVLLGHPYPPAMSASIWHDPFNRLDQARPVIFRIHSILSSF